MFDGLPPQVYCCATGHDGCAIGSRDDFCEIACPLHPSFCVSLSARERKKFIIRQPPIGEKGDYDSENSWISDGLPSSTRESHFELQCVQIQHAMSVRCTQTPSTNAGVLTRFEQPGQPDSVCCFVLLSRG